MIKKYFLITVLLFTIIGTLNSQNKNKLPSIAIGGGILSFNGDVSNKSSTFGRIRGGYNLTIEKRVGKYFGLSLSALKGKLGGNLRNKTVNLNFESKIIQGDLNLVIHIDNNLLFKKDSSFAPYFFVGFGFLKFDPYGDLKDKNGLKYNYWNDGTIHNLPQFDPNATSSAILQRDFTYETKLTDSINDYKRFTLALPVGGGFKLKIIPTIALNIGITYYLTFSDWIDNYKKGKNDSYVYANISLEYNFIKNHKKQADVPLDFSLLDNLDSDGDGVKDTYDNCQGTPAGETVNSSGCPIDSDEDGVPDYLDKEKNTKHNAVVDQNGIALTKKMIADKQMEFESNAADRNHMFNTNPSLEYLKEIESMTSESRNADPNTKIKIPGYLLSADKNKDGYISPEEIKAAIDGFFEKDSDFTVEKINDLINFFFEQ